MSLCLVGGYKKPIKTLEKSESSWWKFFPISFSYRTRKQKKKRHSLAKMSASLKFQIIYIFISYMLWRKKEKKA